MEYESFIIGFLSIILLIQITYLIRSLALRYKALFLTLAYGMLFIDGVALVTFQFLMKPLSNNAESFMAGMGLSIFTAMIHKIKVFSKDLPK